MIWDSKIFSIANMLAVDTQSNPPRVLYIDFQSFKVVNLLENFHLFYCLCHDCLNTGKFIYLGNQRRQKPSQSRHLSVQYTCVSSCKYIHTWYTHVYTNLDPETYTCIYMYLSVSGCMLDLLACCKHTELAKAHMSSNVCIIMWCLCCNSMCMETR